MSPSRPSAYRASRVALVAALCALTFAGAALAQLPVTPPNGGFNQSPPDPSGPPNPEASIWSPDPVFDAGEILQGEVVPHSFKVGNRGKENIDIRAVNPTCGCTIASLTLADGTKIDPKKLPAGSVVHTLKPDEMVEVSIEFNSSGQPTHALEKIINVISSDDLQPALRLTLKCVIVQPLQLDPNLIQFGEVYKGEVKKASAIGTLSHVDDMNITGFEEKPEYVDVSTEKVTTATGAKGIRFDVTLKDNAPLGYVSVTLVAMTDHPKLPRVRIPILALVKSQVVFDTGLAYAKEKLDFKVVPFGEERTCSVDVKNMNPAVPYNITGVDLESTYKDFLNVEVVTLEPGIHYRIDVTTAKNLDAKYFRGNLKIKSDHPDTPEKVITLLGWVKK